MKNTSDRWPRGRHRQVRQLRRDEFYGRLLLQAARDGTVQAEFLAEGIKLRPGAIIFKTIAHLCREAYEAGYGDAQRAISP